jgi:hypothetical protein
MPACDAYIPEGALPPSPGGRVVTPPGMAAHVMGTLGVAAGSAWPGGAASGRVLVESAQGLTSA